MKSLQSVSSGALRIGRITLTRTGMFLLSLVFALSLVVSVSNQKAAAAGECDFGYLCVFKDINYGGLRSRYFEPNMNTCLNIPGPNDTMSSYKVDLSQGNLIYFYIHAGCTGGWISNYAQGSQSPWVGDTYNDKISSFKVFN